MDSVGALEGGPGGYKMKTGGVHKMKTFSRLRRKRSEDSEI